MTPERSTRRRAHPGLRPIVPRPRTTYADEVILAIRTAIVRGSLPPGGRLSEPALARQLGVSRTPVREAIRALEREGLVMRQPGRGLSVVEISVDDVQEIYAIKSVLEGVAVRLACQRASDGDLERLYRYVRDMETLAGGADIGAYAEVSREFHAALIRAARSPRLTALHRIVDTPVQRLRVYSLSQPGRPPDSVREHRAVLDAIRRRDPDEAESLIRSHVDGAGTTLAKVFHERRSGRDDDE
jgi:DNA-binding GntR family transcriptional regulator